MSITQRTAGITVALTEEIRQLDQMMTEICLSTRQQGMSSINTVNIALQKEIDALKSQIATMEKTVEVSQKALAESQRRGAEKPRIYAEKRRAEQAVEDALQAQVIEAFNQYNTLKESIFDPRQHEVEKIQAAHFVMSDSEARLEKIQVGGFGYEGMAWIERYIGIRNLKRQINATVTKSEAWKGKPFTVPYPGF